MLQGGDKVAEAERLAGSVERGRYEQLLAATMAELDGALTIHDKHSRGPAALVGHANRRRTAAGSAASHRAMRTSAPLAPSSAHSAPPPRASAPLRDASTSADAPRDSASQRAVSSPSPPVPPVST